MLRKPQPPSLNIGDRFGRLEIIAPLEVTSRPTGKGFCYRYPCRCDCGRIKTVRAVHLISGESRSCRCGTHETLRSRSPIQGQSGTRLYGIWYQMRDRCENPKNASYPRYGGRRIAVCPEWQGFPAFRTWAMSSGYRDDLTIERIDNDGPYAPANCTWIPFPHQARNRRNSIRLDAFGESKTLSEWSRNPRCSVDRTTVRYRLGQGWDPERAIVTPRRKESGRRKTAPATDLFIDQREERL